MQSKTDAALRPLLKELLAEKDRINRKLVGPRAERDDLVAERENVQERIREKTAVVRKIEEDELRPVTQQISQVTKALGHRRMSEGRRRK